MKQNARIGMTAELQFVVEAKHGIDFAPPGMPNVLSTPWLIWFLEHVAIEAIAPLFAEGEISVGTEIEVQHLAPTPLGQTVTCTARVVQADGPTISFQLEAHDERELVARGFHKRRVVEAERFGRGVRRKETTRAETQ